MVLLEAEKPSEFTIPPPAFTIPSPPVEVKKETPVIAPIAEKVKSAPRTLKLNDILKTDNRTKEEKQIHQAEKAIDHPYSEEQLKSAWSEFAAKRKKLQAEFHMLSQPFQIKENLIVVTLLSPIHDTMLNNMKSELTGFLRETLKNNTIQVTGDLQLGEDKKVMYTNREKFDFLVEKNPVLKELKDRLGLDTDF